jgi:hypothetical protein
VGGVLRCVAERRQQPRDSAPADAAYDAAIAITDERERAYRLREQEDANAWRGPANGGKWK